MPVEETLRSVTLSNGFEELNTLPSHPAWSEGSEKKSCGDRLCWNGFFSSALLDACSEVEGEVWI